MLFRDDIVFLYSCSTRCLHENTNMIYNHYFYKEDGDIQYFAFYCAYLFHLVELYLHIFLLFKMTSTRVSTQSPSNLAPWEGVFPVLFSMWEGVVCPRQCRWWSP